MTDDPKVMVDCFLCHRPFRFGPHVYDGRYVPALGIPICRSCEGANWDGIVPASHPDLIKHLEATGHEVRLNKNGWIDIPPIGSN